MMPTAGNNAATAPAARPQPSPTSVACFFGSSCRRTISTLPASSLAITVASKSSDVPTCLYATSIASNSASASSTVS